MVVQLRKSYKDGVNSLSPPSWVAGSIASAGLPDWMVTSSSCELSLRQPMALSAACAMRSELMGGSVSLEDLQ